MTISNVPNQAIEERGKIGPWDHTEISEWAQTFRELIGGCEKILAAEERGDLEEVAAYIPHMRSALFEVTKALAGTVVAGAPELAGELAKAFYVIHGSVGGRSTETPAPEVANFQPVTCAVLSTETRRVKEQTVDVALLRLSFYDAETGRPSSVDAVLVRRDRSTDERTVVHFPEAPASRHFDQAIDTRAIWLGLADAPSSHPYPCS